MALVKDIFLCLNLGTQCGIPKHIIKANPSNAFSGKYIVKETNNMHFINPRQVINVLVLEYPLSLPPRKTHLSTYAN